MSDKLFKSRRGDFSKMTWILFLVLYLFSLTILFSFVGSTFGTDTEFYTSAEKTIGTGFILNVVTGVSIIPWWLNALFIVLPFSFLGYIIISNLLPTTNSGA